MKFQLIIFLYISLFLKYKLAQENTSYTDDEIEAYKEYCNIQIPDNKTICNNLVYVKMNKNKWVKDISKPVPSKDCCFEKFRINKIVVRRCVYIDNTEDGLNDEKKFLRDTWGVKDLTILCSGGNLKFKFLFFLIVELLL